eukprot:9430685-Heterocapsa_arctica.AAC.1
MAEANIEGLWVSSDAEMPIGGMRADEFRRVYDQWQAYMQRFICFADDTTVLGRESDIRRVRKLV